MCCSVNDSVCLVCCVCDRVCELFHKQFAIFLLFNVMEVLSVGEVLCWIDRVWIDRVCALPMLLFLCDCAYDVVG